MASQQDELIINKTSWSIGSYCYIWSSYPSWCQQVLASVVFSLPFTRPHRIVKCPSDVQVRIGTSRWPGTFHQIIFFFFIQHIQYVNLITTGFDTMDRKKRYCTILLKTSDYRNVPSGVGNIIIMIPSTGQQFIFTNKYPTWRYKFQQ